MKTEAKELIIEMHAYSTKEYKEKLEQEFPELFKPFKNGEWIKHFNGALIRITNLENGEAYGFNYLGNWVEKEKFYTFKTNPEKWQRTTEAEVITAFKKEFEKRGFKEGVKFKYYVCEKIIEFKDLDFREFFNKNIIENYGQCIYSEKFVIYQDGVFAEIVEEEKTIEQRLEAAFIDVFDKASCIQHWHCTGKNNEGMIVSSKHVHELWEVLEKSKSLRNSL